MNDLLRALASAAPDDGAAGDASTFGQFVGEWEVLVTYRGPEGETTLPGTWVFGWVLEGRAVQDVWRVPHPGSAGAPPFGYGTTVRFYDRSIGAWRSTWHGLVKGEVIPFVGGRAGDEIHLDNREGDRVRRWAFSEIESCRFRWKNQLSTDGGAHWTTEQEMRAVRKPETQAPGAAG